MALTFSMLIHSPLEAQGGLSVLTYGAVPDGVMRSDGGMTAGSAMLSSPSGTFTTSDVGKYIQVIGAGPGGITYADGVMGANSATLTSESGSFTSGDIGRSIVMVGAGTDGGNLITHIARVGSATSVTLAATAQTAVGGAPYYYGAMTLDGTIQSVQSSTTVTLSTTAAATISPATYAYGTDNHLAFQAAVDAVGAAGGGQVSVPAAANCPDSAVCGYVLNATDQMTAKAPGAVKIRYNNVSLVGDTPQTNLFCHGAYGTYTNSVAYPGATGTIRGFCLSVGDNSGPNGATGQSVSNVKITNLHLYGMTDGNTQQVNFGYPMAASDGWDVTHKAIYMWDQGTFSNITIDSVIIQDFKGENIYSGGSAVTGMLIQNSTLTNFNGDGISMLAADLQVLNNTISNGSNAGIENATTSRGNSALVHQLYQGNTLSQFPREGLVVQGVDSGIAPGSVDILNNTFDTIAQVNPAGAASAVYITSQDASSLPPANVTFSGNICHDCNTFGIFQTSGNTLVQGNTFTLDQYKASSVFTFEYRLTGVTFSNNVGGATANAFSKNLTVDAVYSINSANSGVHHWKNSIVRGNTWNFPITPLGAAPPQYKFVTTAVNNNGNGWSVVGQDNLNWQGDQCSGCSHSDADHGLVNLSQTSLIEPYGPTVYVNGNTNAVTATVDATKEEDGAQVEIMNAGPNSVSFTSDGNLSLPFTYTLPGGNLNSLKLSYSAAAGKFILGNAAATVVASGGTPQSTVANTSFATQLQVTVTDANQYPVSGAAVTFSVPASGASAAFMGSSTAVVSTNTNGVATAPELTADGQAGTYTVVASVAGLSTTAGFSLTNMPGAAAGVFVSAGTPQSATVGTAFATPLQAVVKDANSNPLSGITVTFSAPTGASAAFSGLANASAVTDGNGVATAPTLTANGQTGSYTVSASAKGAGLAASFSLTNVAAAVQSSAAYNGTDLKTQGSWTGKYGANGYLMPNGASSLPVYASVGVTGSSQYTWASTSSDLRALQTSNGSTNRMASTIYSYSTFTIGVNFTDGNAHRLALYLLDWETPSRMESIVIRDAATNVTLSTQTFSGFHNGEYASWNITGNVVIQVTATGGPNAVVSGIFLDPVSVPSTEVFNGTDLKTQGSWTGKYGANGYLMPSGASSLPVYASVGLTGSSQYTWASASSDLRALQTSNGSTNRMASTFYSYSTFTIGVNLTDGNTHRLALYLLDWETPSRMESIVIRDAATNTTLSTQMFSSFHNGEYASWNITGNLLIQITATAGPNAVVSGIFLD